VDSEISQTEFCAILARLKLLKADLPRTDERWKRFYQKFIVVDSNEDDNTNKTYNERYSPVPTLVALIFLS
jgi:hypothetical protein